MPSWAAPPTLDGRTDARRRRRPSARRRLGPGAHPTGPRPARRRRRGRALDAGSRRRRTLATCDDPGRRARDLPSARCAASSTHVELPASVTDALAGARRARRPDAAGRPRAARLASRTTQNRLARVRDGAMGLAMVPVRRVVAAFPQLVREVATGHRQGRRASSSTARTSSSTPACSTASPTRSRTSSPTPSTTAASSPRRARRAGQDRPRHGHASRPAPPAPPVVIEVADDGPGIDEDALRAAAVAPRPAAPRARRSPASRCSQLLFEPGFSTREVVTETSGRGVGLDVVRTRGGGPRRHHRGRHRARASAPASSSPCRSRSASCAAWSPGSATSATPCRSPTSSRPSRSRTRPSTTVAGVQCRRPGRRARAARGPRRRPGRPGRARPAGRRRRPATAAAAQTSWPGPSTRSRASWSSSSRTSAASSAGCPDVDRRRPSTATARVHAAPRRARAGASAGSRVAA